MRTLPHTHSCFVCGESNPAGLKLRFETDGRIVQTRFTPRAEHIGFKHVVHGGIIATLLDEIMVWACVVQTRRFAFCADLQVRFAKLLRPGGTVTATAELVANRRDKIYEARAELRNANGELVSSATGKYVPVPEADLAEMATEFVDEFRWLFKGANECGTGDPPVS